MTAVVRVGDIDSDFPPDSMKTGSPNVFVNSKKVTRVGDLDDDVPPNITTTGSPNVFINSKKVARWVISMMISHQTRRRRVVRMFLSMGVK
jgi:uncharacterized Zn-binding protein involved in type VI secretion